MVLRAQTNPFSPGCQRILDSLGLRLQTAYIPVTLIGLTATCDANIIICAVKFDLLDSNCWQLCFGLLSVSPKVGIFLSSVTSAWFFKAVCIIRICAISCLWRVSWMPRFSFVQDHSFLRLQNHYQGSHSLRYWCLMQRLNKNRRRSLQRSLSADLDTISKGFSPNTAFNVIEFSGIVSYPNNPKEAPAEFATLSPTQHNSFKMPTNSDVSWFMRRKS